MGIGLGLVAVPVLGLAIPAALPQAIVIASIPLMTIMLWQERSEFDLGEVRWLVVGRFAGALPAFAVLAMVSVRWLQLIIGVSTLMVIPPMVAHNLRFRVTPSSQFVAGAVSGFTGTATGVGGATIALLYQRERAAALRPTLALVMLAGSAVSVSGYVITGRLHAADLALALLLVVPILSGFAVGKHVRGRLDGQRFRTALLLVVGATAGTLVVQAIVG